MFSFLFAPVSLLVRLLGSFLAISTEDRAAGLVDEQLERILMSKAFATAIRSQAFLRYAVEKSLANSAPREYAKSAGVPPRPGTAKV